MRPGILNQDLFYQSLFQSCWPWVVCLIVALMLARLSIALSGAKLQLARLRSVNRCEEGSVQSLSFVMTLPFFLMMVMLVIQASQIMIANIVVHYAAFASVRSAVVWIPANVSYDETANRISRFDLIQQAGDGAQYRIQQSGDKYQKIKHGAVIALTSLGPSRDLGYAIDDYDANMANALTSLYKSMDKDLAASNLITRRMRNKVAYVSANTNVDLTFWHRYGSDEVFREPPLQQEYDIPPYREEFQYNELGWQDHITAQVTFNIPLLPGPARLISPSAQAGNGSATDESGEVYIWPVSGTATMGLEGDKTLLPYVQEAF